MRKFSDGSDANLETLSKWAKIFGSKAEDYVNKKIKESPQGAKEEVLADESQIIYLLSSMM